MLRRYVSDKGTIVASFNWHIASEFTYRMALQRDELPRPSRTGADMTDEIRQTVAVNGRTLHLRRSGSGPAVVLLDDRRAAPPCWCRWRGASPPTSPSSRWISPGFGQSDPLPVARPTIHDFADAVVASLRALGLTRAPVTAPTPAPASPWRSPGATRISPAAPSSTATRCSRRKSRTAMPTSTSCSSSRSGMASTS